MKKIFLLTLSLMFIGTVGNAKVNQKDNDDKTPAGVEAVDLGLSVKWANMNVGATKPSGFGTYFAWGEIKSKQVYSWGTYVWSRGDTQFLLKYNVTDRVSRLAPSDDAARANWGGDWRMPTADEYEELINNCKWEWTNKDGINGYKVTSKKNGKSIFMPITGFRYYEGVQFRAIKGVYWTSELYTVTPTKAWCLEFDFSNVELHFGNLSSNRFSGRCIRAVN